MKHDGLSIIAIHSDFINKRLIIQQKLRRLRRLGVIW